MANLNSYALDEGLKNDLVSAVKSFRDQKHSNLKPRFDELVSSLESGFISGTDAYQARYLRDTLTLGNPAHKEKFKDVLDYLEKFFGA